MAFGLPPEYEVRPDPYGRPKGKQICYVPEDVLVAWVFDQNGDYCIFYDRDFFKQEVFTDYNVMMQWLLSHLTYCKDLATGKLVEDDEEPDEELNDDEDDDDEEE